MNDDYRDMVKRYALMQSGVKLHALIQGGIVALLLLSVLILGISDWLWRMTQ